MTQSTILAAIAAGLGGGGGTSITSPGQPTLGYRTGRLYLACAPLAHVINAHQATADRIFYTPPFRVAEDVTFTTAWMYVTATAAGTARLCTYNPVTKARIAQLGNINLGSTGWRSLGSLSVTWAQGDPIMIGVNYSGTPTVARVIGQTATEDSVMNQRFAVELGMPSFVGDPTDSNVWGTRAEKQTHVYDGSTTPDPAVPTSEDAHCPAVWFSK